MLTSIVENKDHTLLLGGFAKSEIGGTSKKKDEKEINDYVVIKVNEKGEEWWRQSVGSDGEDVLRKAIETRDGSYLLAGTSDPTASSPIPSKSAGSKAENKNSPVTFGNGGQNQQIQKNDVCD